MTKNDVTNYWLDTAKDALKTAEDLFEDKRYNYSLFFCHLAIEKILKGLVFKQTSEHPLPIHNLSKIAQQSKIALSEDLQKNLNEITTWNIQARYDSIKRDFYKKATQEFAKTWLAKVKEIFLWLKNQY
jgi:HEPN domain-containing protein